MSLVFKRFYLIYELFFTKSVTDCGTERPAEAAVGTVIYTIITDVQGSEENYTVSIYVSLEFTCCFK